MKPCANKQKSLTWLALNEPGREEASELRSHLETCPGCRQFYDEISGVTKQLSSVELNTDIRTSDTFHRKVAAALRQKRPVNPLLALFSLNLPEWGQTAVLVGLIAIIFTVTMIFSRSSHRTAPSPRVAQVSPSPNLNGDLPPTADHYQMVAARSFEKLDALLTSEGSRNLPPAPIYTASAFARANLAD